LKKKAQVATEFVSTYGFMILSVSLIIFGLAYFGVLDITKLLPKKCILPPGIACIDQSATPQDISLVLLNGMGYDINVLDLSLTRCVLLNPGLLEANKMYVFNMNCSGLIEGKYKSRINLTFTRTDTGLTQQWVGELVTRIPSNGTYY
jgi:hypothetical protein